MPSFVPGRGVLWRMTFGITARAVPISTSTVPTTPRWRAKVRPNEQPSQYPLLAKYGRAPPREDGIPPF